MGFVRFHNVVVLGRMTYSDVKLTPMGVYPRVRGATPQCGSISLLLSNLYDALRARSMFERVVKPRLQDEAYWRAASRALSCVSSIVTSVVTSEERSAGNLLATF